MKWLETWNYELASPTGPLASLCHRVLRAKNKLLKNCSGYHTREENASVTTAKAFLKTIFGDLIFVVLVFVVLVFENLDLSFRSFRS